MALPLVYDPVESSSALPALLFRVWQERRLLITGAIIGGILALFLVFLLKPHYEASMIVAPPSHDSRTDSFVEGVFVYAPEVEAKIPVGSPEFIRFEQSLRGAAVAELLFRMDGIVAGLEQDSLWRGVSLSLDRPEDVAHYLSEHITIETLGATASRKIVYRHPDPAFAVKFLSILRKADDQIIRTSVKAETETKIEWLKTEFQKTLNPDHRKALAQLLMSEERRRMLLSLETPYAVSVVEEASALSKAVVPDTVVILFLMTGMGGICGAILSLFFRVRIPS